SATPPTALYPRRVLVGPFRPKERSVQSACCCDPRPKAHPTSRLAQRSMKSLPSLFRPCRVRSSSGPVCCLSFAKRPATLPATPISQSNRNCLGAARLVCMTEVSDLPDPVARCRRLPGLQVLRRKALVLASGKSHSALDQRTLRLEVVQSYPECQTTRKTRRPC